MQDLISSSLNQSKQSKKNNKILIIIIVAVILITALGFFIIRPFQTTSKPEISPTPTQEPTPTEKPKIDKDKVKIQVLNGTGTPGQAKAVVDSLIKSGYNIDLIKTANAKEYKTIPTSITARTGFEDIASDIKNVLEKTFDEVKIESSQLDQAGEFDIEIVTGGKQFEEPTTATKPTLTATATPATTPTNPTISPTLTSTPTTTPTPTP